MVKYLLLWINGDENGFKSELFNNILTAIRFNRKLPSTNIIHKLLKFSQNAIFK